MEMILKALILFLLTVVQVSNASTCPNGVRVRKEFRDLSATEWADFKDALRKLHASGRWNNYSSNHMAFSRDAHNNPQFLPWHRIFLADFEKDLQTFNPNVMIPFWDWTFDSQNPMASPIFRSNYLGIQVGPNGDCNWRMTVPDNHCLVRDYNPNNFGTFYSARSIDRLVTASSAYDTFRSGVEGAPHGTVHVLVAGPNGDMGSMQSPNDPLFWLHHAFIDKIWADRQKRSSTYLWQYGGTFNGRAVSLEDVMRPFSKTVRQGFVASSLCYRYQPYSRRMTTSGLEVLPEHEIHGNVVAPAPLPASWIMMQGLNENEVRATEQELNDNINGIVSTPTSEPAPPNNSAERTSVTLLLLVISLLVVLA